MKIGIFDAVINLQPLEKPLLHVSGAKTQTVADIVKKQASTFGKKAANQKSFERCILNAGLLLNGKEVENISVNNKEGIGAAIPSARQFEPPATERKTGLRCRESWF